MSFKQLIPELLVEDMDKSVRFYNKILGLKTEIIFPEKNPVFAQVGKGDVHIMLYERKAFEEEISKMKKNKMGGSFLLHIKMEKIESFYNKIKNKVKVIQKLYSTDYGTKEFSIEDINGYVLAFSEKTSEKS